MSEIYRGSEWRKWDLHFHTPASYDYQSKNITNQEIIDVLHSNGISVVAITDHHVIDIMRIRDLQILGKEKGITVLPGIEFLAELRDKEPIHYIGIFSEDSDLEYIWGQIENRTNLIQIKSQQKKLYEVYCDLEDTIKIIKELGGIVTIHAGNKTNSIENITNSLPHSIAQKTDIAKLVDFYELGKVTDKEGYLNIVFPAIKKHIPMIIASDNHDIQKYTLKENCWIKADKSFEGLKQVIYEPKERVRIQTTKPQEKSGYQAIDSITINHSDFGPLTLYLNQNLNTIIGGRSTGKSILLGTLAKKLNCNKEVKFDNEEYANYVDQIVTDLKVIWKDGIENNDRNIEYFPQGYMYRLAKNTNNELDKLIEDIIKQDPIKSNEINNYKNFSENNNTEIISKINKLYNTLSEYHKIKQDQKELGDEAGIKKEKTSLENILFELRNKVQMSGEEIDEYNLLVNKINTNIKIITELESQIRKLTNLKIKSITNEDLEFEFANINEPLLSNLNKVFKEIKIKYNDEWLKILDALISIEDDQRKLLLRDNMDFLKLSIYQKGVMAFKNNQQYKEVEEKLKIQQNKLFDIDKSKELEIAISKQYNQIKESIKIDVRNYHYKLKILIELLTLKSDKLEIKAKINFNKKRYREILKSSLNLQNFQNQEYANITFNEYEDFFERTFLIFDDLLSNSLTLKGGYTNLSLSQILLSTNYLNISYEIIYEEKFKYMSEGKKAFVVLMLLLDFSNKDCPILIDQPEDDLDNRAIYNDLVKYIKKKRKERQIIVVTHNPNIVVGADSELIIVSNQHGVNSPNNNSVKFDYVSGSIETSKDKQQNIIEILHSQGIRQHICEILEGGLEAFKQRELKYNIA